MVVPNVYGIYDPGTLGLRWGEQWTWNFGHKWHSFLRLGHLKKNIYKHNSNTQLANSPVNWNNCNSYSKFKNSDVKKNLNKVQPNKFYFI